MKVALLTFVVGDDYRRAVRCGLVSKRYYARQTGIPFLIGGEEYWNRERPMSWSKLNLARRYLPEFDAILLSDADVVMMNPKLSLDRIISEHMGDAGVMVTTDPLGFNWGNVFLRNRPDVIELLNRMDALTEFDTHPWWEQRAFIELYYTDEAVQEMTCVIPNQRLFNAYPRFMLSDNPLHCYRPGDLLVHIVDLPVNRTQVRLQQYYQLLKDEIRGAAK